MNPYRTRGAVKTIDKFYTKEDTVNKCYTIINENLNISKDDLIIEPSAGDGAFINCIKKLSNKEQKQNPCNAISLILSPLITGNL